MSVLGDAVSSCTCPKIMAIRAYFGEVSNLKLNYKKCNMLLLSPEGTRVPGRVVEALTHYCPEVALTNFQRAVL